MGVKQIVILSLIFTLSTKTSSAQYQNGAASRNLIASALQDILSTSNTDGALKILKMAAGPTRNAVVPETAIPVRTFVPKSAENLPIQTFVANEIPMPCVMANKEMRMLRPDEITMPRIVANNEVIAFMNPNEVGMPRVIANKDMRAYMGPYETGVPRVIANKEVLMGPSVDMPRVMRKVIPDVYERQIVGKPVMETNRNQYQDRVVDYSPKLGDEILSPYSPPSLLNPFLPIASPVSAFSPTTSNMLPPPTQARSQYLRKTPIPPPTL